MRTKVSPREVRRRRIKKHIRKRVLGTPERPRLVVSRSLKHVFAQIVDDVNQKTLIGISSSSKKYASLLKDAKDKKDAARIIGEEIAKLAAEKKIETVVFDRNGYLYHGRVKALADGARKGGLKF
ncbi:50S ribosomal protein L18 [candidate division KSB1 bacterium]|nr:MAG: 50S ribosomal protein L18 [candidate division KSB1 bacterium]